MLTNITYGTFLLFGGCITCCFLYAMICVPETAKVPLESVHKLFEQNIIKGAFMDIFSKHRRAKTLQGNFSDVSDEKQEGPENISVAHVEQSCPGNSAT
jgi:SP family sugar:H+ symporter-like MFS transporter